MMKKSYEERREEVIGRGVEWNGIKIGTAKDRGQVREMKSEKDLTIQTRNNNERSIPRKRLQRASVEKLMARVDYSI